ncbi:MAG: Epoxide Hydrolase [Chthoniobacter sp.]|nr:Epoxide Hydrolase [Chthoniobacter sp.]
MIEEFKKALRETERTRDPRHVAQLFAGGAHLTNLGGDHGDDATRFWQTYVDQFQEIGSEFIGEIANERGAALEWRSRGRLQDGRDVDYLGVSVIQFDERAITGFRTYYDSAAFLRGA